MFLCLISLEKIENVRYVGSSYIQRRNNEDNYLQHDFYLRYFLGITANNGGKRITMAKTRNDLLTFQTNCPIEYFSINSEDFSKLFAGSLKDENKAVCCFAKYEKELPKLNVECKYRNDIGLISMFPDTLKLSSV